MLGTLRGSKVRKKPQTTAPVQIMPGSLLRREREALPSYVSCDLTLSTADFAVFFLHFLSRLQLLSRSDVFPLSDSPRLRSWIISNIDSLVDQRWIFIAAGSLHGHVCPFCFLFAFDRGF